MDDTISSLCSAIQCEAASVQQYGERIMTAKRYETTKRSAETFEKLRLDHVEHLQELCVELTRIATTATPTAESEG